MHTPRQPSTSVPDVHALNTGTVDSHRPSQARGIGAPPKDTVGDSWRGWRSLCDERRARRTECGANELAADGSDAVGRVKTPKTRTSAEVSMVLMSLVVRVRVSQE